MALKIASRFGPYERLTELVGEAEESVQALTDEELTEAVAELRTTGGLHEDEQIEFLALAREAGRRTIGERAFDGQVVGALAMLQGRVVEMATGEGKTLAGAFAAAGYAVGGRKVQVLAVNDYLARRDAEWMGPVYELLGVTVSHIATRRLARSASTYCATGSSPMSPTGSRSSRTWRWWTRRTRC